MTYRGRVQGGVIVLDKPGSLPEGMTVNIEPIDVSTPPRAQKESLSEVLLRYAGTVKGLPPDASINHDHYLYGTPKRDEHD